MVVVTVGWRAPKLSWVKINSNNKAHTWNLNFLPIWNDPVSVDSYNKIWSFVGHCDGGVRVRVGRDMQEWVYELSCGTEKLPVTRVALKQLTWQHRLITFVGQILLCRSQLQEYWKRPTLHSKTWKIWVWFYLPFLNLSFFLVVVLILLLMTHLMSSVIYRFVRCELRSENPTRILADSRF